MDAAQNIMRRISVRQYSDKETSEDALRTILEAGMAGPSCVNWLSQRRKHKREADLGS